MSKHQVAAVLIDLDNHYYLDRGEELSRWLTTELHLIYLQDFFWYATLEHKLLFMFYGNTEKDAAWFALRWK